MKIPWLSYDSDHKRAIETRVSEKKKSIRVAAAQLTHFISSLIFDCREALEQI